MQSMKLELQSADDEYYWNDSPDTRYPSIYDAFAARGETAFIKGHYGTRTAIACLIGDEVHVALTSEYFRFGSNTDGSLRFVDPSGGPFMSVGAPMSEYHRQLPNRPIKSIDRRGIFVVLELG